MATFMEDVLSDIDEVFLDPDTFGSEHVVNGKTVTIMFDYEQLEEIQKNRGEFRDDVHKGDVLFFAREADLGSAISVNELMELDGKERFVQMATLTEGLWRIVLGRSQV